MIQNLRRVSVIEATSYLALMAASAVKYSGGSALGVRIIGPIHGVLFLVYAGLLLRDRTALEWTPVRTVSAMIIGALPFGGYWVERNWLAPLASTASNVKEAAPDVR